MIGRVFMGWEFTIAEERNSISAWFSYSVTKQRLILNCPFLG